MAVYRNQISTISTGTSQFYTDVVKGLSSSPKFLYAKYFYDAEGDRLFQQIMNSPEYYLTRAEMEIFSRQTKALAEVLTAKGERFDILELGAGDATKSTFLLKYLHEQGFDFTYYPIDISENIIDYLEKEMPRRIPGLEIRGLQGEYGEMIAEANKFSTHKKIVLFLGSTIGNMTVAEASLFLNELYEQMNSEDVLLIGIDLKKDPHKILAAYNDRAGITRAFNLNLLKRINEELEADFDLNNFDHFPTYDPISGSCKSYLVSKVQQQVCIGGRDVISFEKNEVIYMELSQKYAVEETNELAKNSGFKPLKLFFDTNDAFLDAIWERR